MNLLREFKAATGIATLTASMLFVLAIPFLSSALNTVKIDPDANLAVYDSDLEFGRVDLYEEKVSTFVIKNQKNTNLKVDVSLADTDNFTIIGSNKLTLAPAEQRTLSVSFVPNRVGKKESVLTLKTNTEQEFVKLAGRGLAVDRGRNFMSDLAFVSSETTKSVLAPAEITSINYRLNNPARVTVTIQQGNKVIKTLTDYGTLKDSGLVNWDGTNQNGQAVAPGDYRFVIDAFSDQFGAAVAYGKIKVMDNEQVAELMTDFVQTESSLVENFVVLAAGNTDNVEINFDLKEKANVRLFVEDANKKIVKWLAFDKELEASNHKFDWSVEEASDYLVRLVVDSKNSNEIERQSINFVKSRRLVADVIVDTNLDSKQVEPDAELTRVETMSYLVKEFDIETNLFEPAKDLDLGFVDLATEEWLLSPFKTFVKTGTTPKFDSQMIQFKKMIEGYPPPRVVLKPNSNVKRAEFYKLFVEGLANQKNSNGLTLDRNPKEFCFSDVVNNKDTRWYLPYANFVCNELAGTEVMSFHADGKFKADAVVTKAHADSLLKVGKQKGWW